MMDESTEKPSCGYFFLHTVPAGCGCREEIIEEWRNDIKTCWHKILSKEYDVKKPFDKHLIRETLRGESEWTSM